MYDTIVLSGNSTNSVLTIGALQYFYDKKLLCNVKNYIGTSSGAMISLLLSIGYEPLELLTYICSEKLFNKIEKLNISKLILIGNGMTSFTSIKNILEELILKKIGFIPTFSELYTKYDKVFICVTYNLSQEKKIYVSKDTHPNLSTLTGLHMSCNFPFIFDHFKYEDEYYLDGGIIDNFALELAEEIGEKPLGIYITSKYNINPDNSMDLLYKLFKIFINSDLVNKIERSKKSDLINLHGTDFFNFKQNNKYFINLFDTGYEKCKHDMKNK